MTSKLMEPLTEIEAAQLVKEVGMPVRRLLYERDVLKHRVKQLPRINERLLKAVQLAYRKHHLNDPGIGWDELGLELLNALAEAMGDEGFKYWLEEHRRG